MTERRSSTDAKHPEFLEDQREFFDALMTDQWDTYQDVNWDRSRKFEVDRLFEDVTPERILDVGCGCGYHDTLMANKPGVKQVVGIDYSEKSIETANNIYPHPAVERQVADIFSLVNETFDLVVSFQVIEHLTDAQGFLESNKGLTRPGGWVAVVTPNRRRAFNRILQLLGRPVQLSDPQHFREFTIDDLREMGARVGLEYQSSFGYGMAIPIPRLRQNLIYAPLALRLGFWMPSLADCVCVVFRR